MSKRSFIGSVLVENEHGTNNQCSICLPFLCHRMDPQSQPPMELLSFPLCSVVIQRNVWSPKQRGEPGNLEIYMRGSSYAFGSPCFPGAANMLV